MSRMKAPHKIPKATSNADFGRKVGVHYTYASRMRNGLRSPSLATLTAIRQAFELDPQQTAEMLDAAEDTERFGQWINDNLFEESTAPERSRA